MRQRERLSMLLKSANRVLANSEGAPFGNGQTYVRCKSGVTIWSDDRSDEGAEVGGDRCKTPSLASPSEGEAAVQDEHGGMRSGETALHCDSIDPGGATVVPIEDADIEAPSTGGNGPSTTGCRGPNAARYTHPIAPPLPQIPSSAMASARPASDLTHKNLAAVEAQLAVEIGPVARVLVAKYAKQADSLASLEALLEPHIPTQAGRDRVKHALAALARAAIRRDDTDLTQTTLRTLQQHQPRQREGPTSLDKHRGAPTLEQVRVAGAKLATYVGPIAHVIAKREAESVIDLDTLLQRLADSIRNDADRKGFQRACGDIRHL